MNTTTTTTNTILDKQAFPFVPDQVGNIVLSVRCRREESMLTELPVLLLLFPILKKSTFRMIPNTNCCTSPIAGRIPRIV